jgi:LPS export ABC transporter protein LptC
MRSGKGELSPNQELVRLSEGVKATQITDGSRQDRLELETSELLVLTQEERASSTKDVRIQQGGRVLTGKGLELDLKTGQYRVLSQARVEIKP